MNLADQLFNTLVVVNLQEAARLRPLTQAERTTMEQSEAKAGPMLQEFQHAKAQIEADGESPKCP